MVTTDLEEELGRMKWGGVRLKGKRAYSLAYADNMVLLAEEEDEMRSMIGRLEEYLERKGLELNVSKTKVMKLRRGKGRMDKRVWKWKGKIIEEVREFKYIEYVLQRNGDKRHTLKTQ